MTAGVGHATARMVLPRTGTPAALDATERLLATGVEVAGSRTRMGSRGFNGYMERLVLADARDATRTIGIVQRPAEAQAIQEALGFRVARQLGVDYLFPHATVRTDGSAAVQLVPGTEALKAGVSDVASLRRAAARWYEQAMPQMGADAIREQARIDAESLAVVDYLLANHDRGINNLLVDAVDGGFRGVDFGWISGGERLLATRTRPVMLDAYVGGRGGIVELHPRTVELVRANLTADDLRRILGGVAQELERYRPGPDAAPAQRALQRGLTRALRRDEFLEGVLARREQLVTTGRIEYEAPSSLTRTPIAVAGTLGRAWPVPVAAAGTAAVAGAAAGGYALVR